MLHNAHQGYIYQDILSAYLIALEIAQGNLDTKFLFDKKEINNDKFDDIVINKNGSSFRKQIKYSDQKTAHILTKEDISNSSGYDLALSDLYESWKNLLSKDGEVRICLAWSPPLQNDNVLEVLEIDSTVPKTFDGTITYRINPDKIWPKGKQPLSSWRTFRKALGNSNERDKFVEFTKCLVIEVNLPKSTLFSNEAGELEKQFYQCLDRIGVGQYPNNHLNIRETAINLTYLVTKHRANSEIVQFDTTSKTAAEEVNIKLEYGGIEQVFDIDTSHLVKTPNSVNIVLSYLNKHSKIVVVGEPGAGKSWFVSNLENEIQSSFVIIKHYCYVGLHDQFAQRRRIQVNTFYGSIIDQILDFYPNLTGYKSRRFASNLEELNRLLEHIPQKTVLIVDGLDHVWRVYEKNRANLTEDEVSILYALQNIHIANPLVRLLVLSQPISQIDELSDFVRVELPKWSIEEVIKAVEAFHLDDFLFQNDCPLSSFLLEKGEGNALYTIYLINEVIDRTPRKIEDLVALPNYNFNLSDYYGYIIAQLDEDGSIPNAFCGASFSLSRDELVEITGLGNKVDSGLRSLKPILKHSLAYNGYKIFHESFKRFIIEKLVQDKVDIKKRLYSPLANWLRKKDFFKFRKSYQHLFSLLIETEELEIISNTIDKDFIHTSLYHGHPISTIEENHKAQAKSLAASSNLEHIVIIAEQSKIVFELSNHQGQPYLEYLQALKSLHGVGVMQAAIFNEGCMLIEENIALDLFRKMAYQGEQVDWEIVFPLEEIDTDYLESLTTSFLQRKQFSKLETLLCTLKGTELGDERKLVQTVVGEIKNWLRYYKDTSWLELCPTVKKFLQNRLMSDPLEKLQNAIKDLLSLERHSADDRHEARIRLMMSAGFSLGKIGQYKQCTEIADLLKNINWFYNWVVFSIRISSLCALESFEFEELETAFSYLARDVRPFEGKPRACDLYSLHQLIHSTFRKGLALCKSYAEVKKCVEYLEKVTETTTSLQRSYSGPLIPEKYLELIEDFLPTEDVISKYDEKLKALKNARVFSDIGSVAFQLCCLKAKLGDITEAERLMKEGIQFFVAYGFRKDRTLSELLDSCLDYLREQPENGLLEMQKLFNLSMAVAIHTDGKGTNWYPVEWFVKFLEIFPNNALAYLATESIKNESYHFHQEEQLLSVLKNDCLNLDPLIKILLIRTLPTACDSDLFMNILKTVTQVPDQVKSSTKKWTETLLERVKLNSSTQFPQEVIEAFSEFLGTDAKHYFASDATPITGSLDQNNTTEENSEMSSDLSSFTASSLDEALGFLEAHDISEKDEDAVKQFVLKLEHFWEKKIFVKELIRKGEYTRKKKTWVLGILPRESEEWIYANIAAFVYEKDGWLKPLSNSEAFIAAYNSNNKLAIDFLKEILSEFLENSGYSYMVSGNLIIALSKVSFSGSLLKKLWEAAFEIIDHRIPVKFNYSFEENILPCLDDFSIDELSVCILISRLKTLTVERTQAAIFGLTLLAKFAPKKLVRPLFWSFSHPNDLLPIHKAALLQIVLEKNLINHSQDLAEIIRSQYPTNFFFSDFLIEKILDLESRELINLPPKVVFPPDDGDTEMLGYLHWRYFYLAELGFEFSGFRKEFAYLRDKQKDSLSLFGNISEQACVQTVVPSNNVYSIVQERSYKDFQEYADFYPVNLYHLLRFSLENMSLVFSSRAPRPKDLILPSEESESLRSIPFVDSDGWVRIASLEEEIHGDRSNRKHEKMTQILSFKSNSLEKFRYAGSQFHLPSYQQFSPHFAENSSTPIIWEEVNDFFENRSIYFLSPYYCQKLGITLADNVFDGLNGISRDGEVVLYWRNWASEFVGSRINEEMPKRKGNELVIRADYFNSLCGLYKNTKPYIIRKKKLIN